MQKLSARQGRATEEGRGVRTLVIGCGFIGSHIVTALAATGEPPVVLTRSRPDESISSLLPPGNLRVGDASDPKTVADALIGIDHVVFSAGGLLPAASEGNPELDAELTLVPLRTVLDALRRQPGASLIYLSSGGTVYGEPTRVPIDEEHETSPIGVYGRLHLQCEAEVMRHRREFGLSTRILRCSTVYGERQLPDRGQGAVVTFLHRIEQGLPIEVYGGGGTIRDYVYAGDVAEVVRRLVNSTDGPAIVNLGSGQGTSLVELIRLIEDQVGRGAEIVEHGARGFEVHKVVLDISRLRSLTPFAPTPLETGIKRTHAWIANLDSQRV